MLALLGGCGALTPIDELTWSTELARTLPLEDGKTVEAARFSKLRAGADSKDGWYPFAIVKGNTPTSYQLVEQDGTVVIQADSAEGGSGLSRNIHFDPHRYPIIEWRWRVPRDSGRGGANGPSSVSPPVRLSLAFDGDVARLDFDDRTKLRMAKVLTANGLPYASLLYVWLNQKPVNTLYPSPHTERVRHIAIDIGAQREHDGGQDGGRGHHDAGRANGAPRLFHVRSHFTPERAHATLRSCRRVTSSSRAASSHVLPGAGISGAAQRVRSPDFMIESVPRARKPSSTQHGPPGPAGRCSQVVACSAKSPLCRTPRSWRARRSRRCAAAPRSWRARRSRRCAATPRSWRARRSRRCAATPRSWRARRSRRCAAV